jgi:hypothetical protein
MRSDIRYEFHHMGIPTNEQKEGEIYSAAAGMFTSDNPGKFRVQWHRFEVGSTLHPLIRTVPHPAFKVADLQEAIDGEEVLLGPYEPIDGYRVAIIRDGEVPVELIETSLADEEVWARAKAGQGSLYRTGGSIPNPKRDHQAAAV